MGKTLETILCICLLLIFFVVDTELRHLRFCLLHNASFERKSETRESLDQLTHQHSPHWEQVKNILHWRQRLHLSRLRGKKWALTLYVKLISLFSGIGPKVAQWIIDEYMITTKVEDLPAPADSWVCAHCGTANDNTALFCKDCGEYK